MWIFHKNFVRKIDLVALRVFRWLSWRFFSFSLGFFCLEFRVFQFVVGFLLFFFGFFPRFVCFSSVCLLVMFSCFVVVSVNLSDGIRGNITLTLFLKGRKPPY